ncbi:MAG: Permease of the major facilitator superfamily-like protein [Bryobacterales bacterium]|nr:Permease of the major facilitator superfamily-like protein [Bryobacterales bacterium]
MTSSSPEYSVREQRGWYLYDWANSPFATSVLLVFLGPYLTALAKAAADANGYIHPFGIPVDARSLYPYLISISVVGQVIFLPVVGAIADFGHRKKELLALTAFLGAAAAIAMFFIQGANYMLGAALLIVSNISFGASLVVYNSFLPEIAPPEQRDAISSRGWALGYAGGGVLLALNLALLAGADKLGISEAMAVRISLASAGVWWVVFTIPVLFALRNRGPARVPPPGQNPVALAFRQLAHTLRDTRRYPQTLLFLAAYMIYNDAIQTVLAVAGQFGTDALGIPISQLTVAILMAQFIGIVGAIGFSRLAARIGAKLAVAASLVIWAGILIYIFALVHTTAQFFLATAGVAIAMGGSQALSRSLFAQLVPAGKEAEYFSIYEISDKGTSWLGPAFYGLALQWTGSYRAAILSLIVFFIAGLAILSRVDVEKGEQDVAVRRPNEAPAQNPAH